MKPTSKGRQGRGIDLGALQQSGGTTSASTGFLRGAGGARVVGTDTIRGVRTTHYDAYHRLLEAAAAGRRGPKGAPAVQSMVGVSLDRSTCGSTRPARAPNDMESAPDGRSTLDEHDDDVLRYPSGRVAPRRRPGLRRAQPRRAAGAKPSPSSARSPLRPARRRRQRGRLSVFSQVKSWSSRPKWRRRGLCRSAGAGALLAERAGQSKSRDELGDPPAADLLVPNVSIITRPGARRRSRRRPAPRAVGQPAGARFCDVAPR